MHAAKEIGNALRVRGVANVEHGQSFGCIGHVKIVSPERQTVGSGG